MNNKSSYSDVMRELDIEIISSNNPHICNSNSVNLQKDEKTNEDIFICTQDSKNKNRLTILRFSRGRRYLKIIPKKSTKTEKGCIYS